MKTILKELLNVGSGYEISIKDLSIKIKDIVGFQGDLFLIKACQTVTLENC